MRALRFVENVYDYMHAADVFVTKPGGLSTAEALVARVPMVLCKPLPGQEERNARVLVERAPRLRTRRVDELPAALEARSDRSRCAANAWLRPRGAWRARTRQVKLPR